MGKLLDFAGLDGPKLPRMPWEIGWLASRSQCAAKPFCKDRNACRSSKRQLSLSRVVNDDQRKQCEQSWNPMTETQQTNLKDKVQDYKMAQYSPVVSSGEINRHKIHLIIYFYWYTNLLFVNTWNMQYFFWNINRTILLLLLYI